MAENADQPTLFDELLDLALRGRTEDVRARLAGEHDLGDDEVRQLEGLLRLPDTASEPLATGTQDEDIGSPGAHPGRIGPFRILRELGVGGMGIVYLAEDESLKRRLALKVLRTALGGGGSEGRLRFQREAQAIAALRHANIVTIYAVGRDGDTDYLAMEYIAGPGLDDVIAESREGRQPDVVKVVTWTRDIARGLAAAHRAGIVHRDVKPSNIRITEAGRAVLVDFGLAHNVALHSLTLTGAFRGSPYYASPEQVAARRIPIDHRTDVYSLGVTLFEGLTGRVPFDGETSHQVFNQILVKDPPSTRRLNPAITADLETVIQKALEKDPDRRYETAEAFADDLDALLEMRPIRARPAGVLRRMRKWTRRHPWRTTAAAAVVLLLTGLAGTLAFQSWARSADVRALLAGASSLRDQGAFDEAIADYDRALGIERHHPQALDGRARAMLERDRARAERALADAHNTLTALKDALRDASAAEERMRVLSEMRVERTMTAAEVRQLQDDEMAKTSLVLVANEASSRVEEALVRAERAVPEDPAIAALRAELAMVWWREALRNDDTTLQRVFMERVQAADPDGIYREELDGRGTLRLALNPPDATVYLFRYQRHGDVVPGGDLRLVPVPVGPEAAPVDPGTIVLRVCRPGVGLEREDVVLAINGYPIEETVLVFAGRPPVRRFDRLLAIDTKPIARLDDVTRSMQTSRTSLHRFEFAQDGRRVTAEGTDLEAIGVELGPLHEIASASDVPARVCHEGRIEETLLPKGSVLRATATPLILMPGNRATRGPDSTVGDLFPGSYLALVRARGFEDMRIPFVVPRSGAVVLDAHLLPEGSTPPGFVRIPPPPGAATDGGRPGFWIMDREITGAEYQLFLDSDAVRVEIPKTLQSPRPRFIPRQYDMVRRVVEPIRGALQGDRWQITGSALPYAIGGISFDDALAYAAWRTHEWQAEGGLGIFDLPTREEWRRAGQGADGRPHAWGDALIPAWTKIYTSQPLGQNDAGKPLVVIEPPLSYPIDESPFGVFDLCGSQMEWGRTDDGSTGAFGGAWLLRLSDGVSLGNMLGLPRSSTQNYIGVRLVYRRD